MATPALLIESQDSPLVPNGKTEPSPKSGALLDDSGIQLKYPAARVTIRREARHGEVAAGIRALAEISEARRRAVAMAELARREFRWLSENRRQYAHRWVALDGDRLLVVGDTAREVYAAIADYPGTPLVTQVEPTEEVHFGGW